jgi:hypothetical protein
MSLLPIRFIGLVESRLSTPGEVAQSASPDNSGSVICLEVPPGVTRAFESGAFVPPNCPAPVPGLTGRAPAALAPVLAGQALRARDPIPGARETRLGPLAYGPDRAAGPPCGRSPRNPLQLQAGWDTDRERLAPAAVLRSNPVPGATSGARRAAVRQRGTHGTRIPPSIPEIQPENTAGGARPQPGPHAPT